ncbi:MAG TPA: AAA+ family ATPase, partial [Nitrococcus sp.]|nr:AAA+ family ATPase [Nitrococcus sp.]
RVHAMPHTGQDVSDDLDARLVVLGADHPYSKEPGNAAEAAAQAILESRGSIPRLYRNTLVFLAADRTRLQDLDEAVRRYLAWESIVAEREPLDLSAHQVKQAETQKSAADGAVTARLPETYQWLLVPVQETPQSPVTWQPMRLSGQEALAVRASRKLKHDELLVTGFAATRLRMELDRVPLWRGEHVAIKQLIEDFARYIYLPRLKSPAVLLGAISEGIALLTWEQDAFAFADSYDEAAQRYRGLRAGQLVSVADADVPGLLVKPEVARQQLETERMPPLADASPTQPTTHTESKVVCDSGYGPGAAPANTPTFTQPKRFYGTVELDATRVGRDASRIADEVVAHLASLVGANVRVTLEVEAELPSGAPEHVVRTVTENSRTLKFTSQGFEKE